MKWCFRIAMGSGVALAILSPLAGAAMSAVWGREVILISPHDPGVIELEKISWVQGEPVVDLYGIQNGGVTRVIFSDPDRIIVPEEDPSLILLKVDKQAGENPLQAQTVWFFVKWLVIGGLAAAAAAFGLRQVLRLRSGRMVTSSASGSRVSSSEIKTYWAGNLESGPSPADRL